MGEVYLRPDIGHLPATNFLHARSRVSAEIF
jgi:hypothetical protein